MENNGFIKILITEGGGGNKREKLRDISFDILHYSRILYKDEHSRIILKIVEVFDFPILIFE